MELTNLERTFLRFLKEIDFIQEFKTDATPKYKNILEKKHPRYWLDRLANSIHSQWFEDANNYWDTVQVLWWNELRNMPNYETNFLNVDYVWLRERIQWHTQHFSSRYVDNMLRFFSMDIVLNFLDGKSIFDKHSS